MTPTSYLELIGSFKTLITQKQESTMKAKKRYLVGLDKLAFAASQVNSMAIDADRQILFADVYDN